MFLWFARTDTKKRRGKERSANLRSTLTHWETLESRHCRAAVDDVIAKTEADFSPDLDPEQLLVTSLNILGNDKALSGNLADLSIVNTTACVNTENGGFLKFTRDDTGRIVGVKYGLPTRAIISEDKFEKAKDFVLAEINAWHAEEVARIVAYYHDVSEVVDRFVQFYRANVGAGAGWFASAGGSSLKDIGSATIGLKPGPGAVLSVGGRAMELLLSAYRNSQLDTLDELVSATREQLRRAREADFDAARADALCLATDFLHSLSGINKKVFGNDSFVYTEVDKAPVVSPASRPIGIAIGSGGGVPMAAASLFTRATVSINISIEDFSGLLSQVKSWRRSHDLETHRYDDALLGSRDDMYGDALVDFARRAGFGLAWDGSKWIGQDVHSAVEANMWQGDGAYGMGVVFLRSLTFDGIDISGELNRIGYVKK